MNHIADQDEMEAMGAIDFIVPLKQVGLISRSVLEAIREFYQPRRIIVVTRKAEGVILNKLHPHWNCGPVECVDEETFFVPNFNLTLENIVAEYDADRPGDQREPGWWIQQLIKLGAATQIPNISPTYVVWDGAFSPRVNDRFLPFPFLAVKILHVPRSLNKFSPVFFYSFL
jgi:hypothetical protein